VRLRRTSLRRVVEPTFDRGSPRRPRRQAARPSTANSTTSRRRARRAQRTRRSSPREAEFGRTVRVNTPCCHGKPNGVMIGVAMIMRGAASCR
jgi:hypothetical protein